MCGQRQAHRHAQSPGVARVAWAMCVMQGASRRGCGVGYGQGHPTILPPRTPWRRPGAALHPHETRHIEGRLA
jgi:hypothetical protein